MFLSTYKCKEQFECDLLEPSFGRGDGSLCVISPYILGSQFHELAQRG